MSWHITDVRNLASIDQAIAAPSLKPAQYEIIRRIIYATADFEYLDLIEFSPRVLTIAAAALASRTPLLVDSPMVQAGIINALQKTFANPVYCGTQTITRPQKDYSPETWGMLNLARRYPDSILVVGQTECTLDALLKLVKGGHIQPVLIIATPPHFTDQAPSKQQLPALNVPFITTRSPKGNSAVAVAIINGLVDLAWRAYEQKAYPK